jgi:ATP-dependent Lhr-like helicase
MVDPLAGFHPIVREWFTRRFGAPSPAQLLGWPAIANGNDVLLCAPTGSGKTLAAFMWAIDRLIVRAEAGGLSDGVSILYVSPLKALANDIRINLDEPLEGVRAVASERKIVIAPVRAGLRTGDTPVRERGAMLRRPPHILVTTPESLFILLTSAKFREKLRTVQYVIVDELHALAGNKRGVHLMLTLERLEHLIVQTGAPRPARIGLSATLHPIERLAEVLFGGQIDAAGIRRQRPFKIVRADERPRLLDLRVIAPGPQLGPIATHEHWEAMYDKLADLIREHRTTLVFTLSRRWAERIALNLQKKLGADAVAAHHGSLARKERLDAEQRLKRGELKAIVATASLELGIDVGVVDLVCQIDSPKSISAAVQRVGRSGHSLGATPKGFFFVLTLDDLLECAAAVRAIRSGQLDEVEPPSGCLDVAAQQIIAVAAEEAEISERELLDLLRRTWSFASFTLADLRKLLAQLATELPDRIQGATPKIFWDREGGHIRARRSARLAAITSGGTIPENGNYDVVIESTGRKIGDVEEDFAQESVRGDVFALGSMPWQIQRISRGRLMVESAPGMAPSLPFWMNEAGGRSPALSAQVSTLRHEIASHLENSDALAEWLGDECGLERSTADQLIDYVRRGVAALGVAPTEKALVAERFFDGIGGTQIVIHSPFGMRFNRGLGFAIRKRLCQSFDFEIQASATDDGVLLALNSRHSFPLEQIFSMVTSRSARSALTQAILNAPMFEVRFRHVATRALTVIRNFQGRKVPAWIQRLRSQDLATALFPGQQACFENRPLEVDVPDHFIPVEAVRECLEASCDLSRMIDVLRGIEDGSIKTHVVDSISPSVFAQRLLLAWDYSFLDGGERANRRSRTVQMNRGLAEDVFRADDLSGLLSAEVVEQVEDEVTAKAPSRRARDSAELYELIRAHGGLRAGQIADRVSGDPGELIDLLRRAGRIAEAAIDCEHPALLIACEDRALFKAAFPQAQFDPEAVDRLETIDPGIARETLIQRAMRTSGPLAASDLAARIQLPLDDVNLALLALESKGSVFRGRFTRVSEQWCDRYNLERIHRLTLARVRAEVEPCADHEFAAFRLRWQHIGGADLPSGVEGLSVVLEQLSGLAFAPQAWESAILPARIKDYRSELLDLLCVSGQMQWVAPSAPDVNSEIPSRVCFVPRGQPIFSVAGPDPTATILFEDERIFKALGDGGAQFLDQVADRAGVSERDALKSLWRLAASGLASNDSFAPLRFLSASSVAQRALEGRDRPTTRRDAAIRARLRSSLSGRWTLLRQDLAENVRPEDRPRELAMRLLERNGVLAREMIALESTGFGWGDIRGALRRLEYSGAIRRGYFVRSLSGEQYALPEALEMLRSARSLSAAREAPLAMSAADPANPYGALLPGCGIARDAANLIVIRAGRPVMGVTAHQVVTIECPNDESFSAGLAALIAFARSLSIESVDGVPALESDRVGLMAAMKFHSNGRALIFDGLHGPAPARAARVGAIK